MQILCKKANNGHYLLFEFYVLLLLFIEREDVFMICGNCGKEIGNSKDCSYCGYNPIKDSNPNGSSSYGQSTVTVPPVQMVLKKKSNGMARKSFIFSFFSFIYIPFGILSLIFGLIGFFRAKRYRSGRVLAILGLLFSSFWALFWWTIINSLF